MHIISLILASMCGEAEIRRACILTQNHDYIASQAILKTITPSDDQRNIYEFYRLANSFCLNNKKESLKSIGILENICVGLPERYKTSIMLMKGEVDLWGDYPEMDDIARDMKKTKDRLLHARGGPETQKIQQTILDRLDKKIKDMEDAKLAKNQSEKDGSGAERQPSNRAQEPLPDSQIVQEGGKGIVNNIRLKNLRERWGSLPPREREASLQNVLKGLSARYRESVSNYFRNLTEIKK